MKCNYLIIILILANCHWHQIEPIAFGEKKPFDFKNKRLGVDIELDFDKPHSINLNIEHYKFISMFVPSFRKMNIFNEVGYLEGNSDIQINIKISPQRVTSSMFSLMLSSITLGIIPVYYTHSFVLDVKMINFKKDKKITFLLPIQQVAIGSILYKKSYYDLSNTDFVDKVVLQIAYKGIESGVFN
ncbi:hypothetical protein [Leptospira interrogans]|uniref:Uncharacterized protein n=1 Tax=Leptospira interrogans serovar Bataviae TaxID=312175 RepID=A0AAP9WK61_LEPIR|nr:hypothetical protein [Leptospira interrogans]EKR27722.1 hypothetical protein LEP1GSC087_2059 [Leptospira interrogans serovar Bataviae str. L1111]EMN70606.1 hypothetical protein LEP1GSC100_0691 [Leptospira interrogans serovar Bataviae str. UI 08561]QOI50433.1 hypothetical protein Lepto1489_08250 [Leptospira interrogans serovar Bataviae]WOT12045.1 hypothetical protein CFY92_0006110 [Leptospira interrogans]